MKRPISLIPLLLVTATLSIASPGCGVLIGNVKPVDQKSDQYGIADLSKENPAAWTRLNPAEEAPNETRDPETTATEIPDRAFQSKNSPAIIAINSSCRLSSAVQDKSLREATDQLLLGISGVTQRVEKNLTVQTFPALETSLQGRMNGKPISVRTVVLRRATCVFDLLYMAPPSQFQKNEADFSHFVASLRLK